MGHERDAKIAEIDRNLEAFLKIFPDIAKEHAGEYALMHNGKIVDYFPSALDAQIAGNVRYQTSDFSIQHVQDDPAELGYYSYALHTR